MATSGEKLLNALRRTKSKSSLYDVPDEYFTPDELLGFQWLRNFVEAHSAWPEPQTFKQETGFSPLVVKEPLSYYLNDARKRTLWQASLDPFKKMKTALEDKQPDDFIRLCKEMVAMSHSVGSRKEGLTTLAESLHMVGEDYELAKRTIGLRGVPTGFPFLDDSTDGFQNANLYSFVARTGVGKALAMDARVLLVNGNWKLNKDLSIGDELASPDGRPSKVTGVYPQGTRPAYKVTFSDGRHVIADADHLWQVRCDQWAEPTKVVTTRQLIVAMSKSRNRGRIGVPLVSGDFGVLANLPIDPWLLGALIGDGCLVANDLRFSTEDQEIYDNVIDTIPIGMQLRHINKYDYTFTSPGYSNNPLKQLLFDLGLWGSHSEHKFIPDIYLSASKEQRIALLQGLMDTDGTASETGVCEFSTSSARLAYQVQYLARSLGAIARIVVRKTKHLNCYRVKIRVKNPTMLFRLSRKKARVRDDNQYSVNLCLKITSIDKVDDQAVQCISVSHPDSLYVTDDFIVTHNTWKLIAMAIAAHLAGYSVLFLTMEMGVVQVARRALGLISGVNPKFIRKGQLSSRVQTEMQAQIEGYQSEGGAPFYWMAGNFKKTVDALGIAVHEVEPDIVFADASYLLKRSDRNKFNAKHELLADVQEGLNDISVTANRPVVQSIQFNRTAIKSKKGGDEEADKKNPIAHLDLTKIGGTDSVAWNSAGVYGLAEGDNPFERTRRYCGTLKGREGETGWYEYSYEFQPVRFQQLRDHTSVQSSGPTGEAPDMSFMNG